MEVEIKNFGPIDNLKFDLGKDLHLIYGKNAIGKSYATYCLYCLIKNIKNNVVNYGNRFVEWEHTSRGKSIIKKIEKLKLDESIDFTTDYWNLLENELKEAILNRLNNAFLNTFLSLKNLKNAYSNKNFEIIMTISNSEKLIIYLNDAAKLDLKYVGHSSKIRISDVSDGFSRYALFKGGLRDVSGNSPLEFFDALRHHIYVFSTEIVKRLSSGIREIYCLPASRSGLYQALNAFTPILAELTRNRFFMQNKSIELPSLSEPVADYFIDLSTIDKKYTNHRYNKIIEYLQDEILGGEIEYNDKTKKIVYKPKNVNLELGLSEASSMVAELSPLVLYLKHILNNKYGSMFKGLDTVAQMNMQHLLGSVSGKAVDKEIYDILFIEEPEAHLHPEVQVKLMDVFAKLSELGLKVFITSHSNYMFNKLNNLLIKKEINKDKVQVYHLIKTPLGSTVNSEMVVTEDGVNDENFQETSEQLYYERLNYLEGDGTEN